MENAHTDIVTEEAKLTANAIEVNDIADDREETLNCPTAALKDHEVCHVPKGRKEIERENIYIYILLCAPKVVSNVLVFFLAGFETTSSALAYLLYVLATNDDVQRRLRTEIATFDKTTPECLYSAVMSSKYLDQVVLETLRLYPPVTSYVFV